MKKWLVTILVESPDSWDKHSVNNEILSHVDKMPTSWNTTGVDVVQQDEADDDSSPLIGVDNGPLVEDNDRDISVSETAARESEYQAERAWRRNPQNPRNGGK